MIPCKDKKNPQAVLIPQYTHLTCSTLQIVQQKAKVVADQFINAQVKMQVILNQISDLKQLLSNRNQSVNFLERCNQQLDFMGVEVFNQISTIQRQKIYDQNSLTTQKKHQQYQKKYSNVNKLLESEDQIVEQLTQEVNAVQQVFETLRGSLQQQEEIDNDAKQQLPPKPPASLTLSLPTQ